MAVLLAATATFTPIGITTSVAAPGTCGDSRPLSVDHHGGGSMLDTEPRK